MSLLEALFGDLSADSSKESVVHPTSICPSDCDIAPGACDQCQPYKEKLIDALYQIDHLDEFRARYEVVGTTAVAAGAAKCPYCNGLSSNPYTCDYCGVTLQEATGKIQVASANDIPNPIMDAQNIIFERYNNVVRSYATTDAADDLLENLASFFLGFDTAADDDDDAYLGNQMSEDEITQMADAYGVSVSAYLRGVDSGQYLTLTAYRERKAAKAAKASGAGTASAGAGTAGALGLGALASLLLGSSALSGTGQASGQQPAQRAPQPQPRQQPRPQQQPGRQPQPKQQSTVSAVQKSVKEAARQVAKQTKQAEPNLTQQVKESVQRVSREANAAKQAAGGGRGGMGGPGGRGGVGGPGGPGGGRPGGRR